MDSATTGFWNRGYQFAGALFAGVDRGAPGALGDELVEVIGLGVGDIRTPKSSSNSDIGVTGLIPTPGLSRCRVWLGLCVKVCAPGGRDNCRAAGRRKPSFVEQSAPRREQ